MSAMLDSLPHLEKAYSFESIPDAGLFHSPSKDNSPKEDRTISDFKLKELRGELLPEPLLVEQKSRFVLFPIKHDDVSLSQY